MLEQQTKPIEKDPRTDNGQEEGGRTKEEREKLVQDTQEYIKTLKIDFS